MFEKLTQDYYRYGSKKPNLFSLFLKGLQDAGFRAMILYRLGHWGRKKNILLLGGICERLMRHWCLCWISTKAEIEGGLRIAHGIGLVIGDGSVIGKNCDVRQNVTLGGNFSKKDAQGRMQPLLGDNVSIAAGAVLLGPVKVGSNSIIGANAVVVADIPENVIAAGVPARVIKERWDENSDRKL